MPSSELYGVDILEQLAPVIPERVRVAGFESYNGNGPRDFLMKQGFVVELKPYDQWLGHFFARRR